MGNSTVLRNRARFEVNASNIVGWKVENPEGENLGKVESVIVDPRTQKATRVVIAFGGFLGLGEKHYAVPLESLSPRSEKELLILPVDKATVKEKAEGWEASEPAREPAVPAEAMEGRKDAAPQRAAATERSTVYFPTGHKASSALQLDLDFPGEILAGEEFTQGIVVTNVSPQALDGVVVREDFGAEIETRSTREFELRGGELHWQVGTLKPGESRELRVAGRLKSGSGALRACCRATYDLSLCVARPVVVPKVELSVALPREALLCEEIPLELRVRNAGTSRLEGLRVEEDLPKGLSTAKGDESSYKVDWGTLEPGGTKDATIPLKASRPGEYALRGRASAGRVSATNSAHVAVREPVLAIAPAFPAEIFTESTGRGEFVVKNTGDGPSRETVLEATVSGPCRFSAEGGEADGSGGAHRWKIGTLAPGESRSVIASLATSNAPGNVEVALKATGYCARPATARAEVPVKGVPAVLLECVDRPDPAKVGEHVTYTISVTNQGSAMLTNVMMKCDLEDSMEYASSKGETEGRAAGGSVEFGRLRELASHMKAIWQVTIRALRPADARFKITLTSDQVPRPVEETESTHFY